ncbi:phosphatase PAP2 family protein [Roseateles sp. MS654]|uniref:phosphatase PAP2 family protein n=1 Tax=Roseateles sp. MS654 TaxID=3412685 RepID=UPI003C2F28F1
MKLIPLLLCTALLGMSGSCGAAAADPQPAPYLDVATLDSTRFMAPPPDDAATRAEIQWMLDLQRDRTESQSARAVADLEQSVFRFADVMGPGFVEARLPRVAAFFSRLYRTESEFNKQGKQLWRRDRPPMVDERLKPVAKFANSGSYPSGHAAFGFLAGIVLADMVPERRARIMARAREFGDNRVLGGVHFPSDVEAGRQLAVLIAALVQHLPAYQSDFALARAELRHALDLP